MENVSQKIITVKIDSNKNFSNGYHRVNSQAPFMPELATRGVFRLSRLSISSYFKTVKKFTFFSNHYFTYYTQKQVLKH